MPPFFILLFFGESLFAFVFGPNWSEAAQLAMILAAPAAVKTGTMPVTALIPALRIYAASTALEALFFPRIFLVLAASALGYGLLAAMLWLAVVSILYDLIMAGWALRGGLKHDRKVAKRGVDHVPPV